MTSNSQASQTSDRSRLGLRLLAVAGLAALVAACDGQTASVDAPSAPSSPAVEDAAMAEPVVAQKAAPQPLAPTTANTYKSQQQPIIHDEPRIEKPRHVGIYTPPRGSAERVALMNALRGQVRADMGGDVVFVVNNLKSNGEWAFGELTPTWPDGRAIRFEGTPAYRNDPHRDGLRTEAIWRKQNGRWTTYAHAVGATDVWWVEHCSTLPRGLLRGC